jgi:hypothetical protein
MHVQQTIVASLHVNLLVTTGLPNYGGCMSPQPRWTLGLAIT